MTFFKIRNISILLLLIATISCNKSDEEYIEIVAEKGEELLGGEGSVIDISPNAFGNQITNLTDQEGLDFFTGNSLFRDNWVTAPATTTARDGLGPLFNARSCSNCHFKDGRGRAPLFEGENNHGLLLRLSTADNVSSVPIYGGQLQDQAVGTLNPEGGFIIKYQDIVINYTDKSSVTLKKPIYELKFNYGSPMSVIKTSPRVASQMVGLGLLEAVSESTILNFVAIQSTSNSTVSGKANYVYDVLSKKEKIGRFGWKANQPSIKQQVAGAFAGDMGITSSLFPDENCPKNEDCSSIANGGKPEISDENLQKVTLYSSTLAVPIRRNYKDENVLKGKDLFNELKCNACHVTKMVTGDTHPIKALRNQTIRPYTDLLLHDMGDDLADESPDHLATKNEWRTPPLWGIGLIETVNGHTNLMHDGRAKNIEEAILWHGGEALFSKNSFINLSKTDRERLIQFIKSL